MQQRQSGPQDDEILCPLLFPEHSSQLTAAPTPRLGSSSGIGVGGEAATSPDAAGGCSPSGAELL